MCWRVDDWAGVLGGGRRIRWTGRASGRAVQGLGDRVWVGWDVGLVEYQYEGGRKGIAKCLVHLRMKQIYQYLKRMSEGYSVGNWPSLRVRVLVCGRGQRAAKGHCLVPVVDTSASGSANRRIVETSQAEL